MSLKNIIIFLIIGVTSFLFISSKEDSNQASLDVYSEAYLLTLYVKTKEENKQLEKETPKIILENAKIKWDISKCTPFTPGADANIPIILGTLDSFGITNINQRAYVLATARHESAQFRTLNEYASGSEYEGRAELGNTQPGDGVKYKGRGYVQLTGRTNYKLWSKWLNKPFVDNPDLVNECSEQSAFILVSGMKFGSFTAHGTLESYINDSKQDFLRARQLVNGYDQAQLITNYAIEYRDNGTAK